MNAASAKVATDQPERMRALDPAESFIVQAPAGSGKTELLIQRILTLLARVEQPERILAITFTRKAAGEMRTRVIESLAKGDSPHAVAVLAQDQKFGWDLRANPSRLRIQTIDSLCASIVRRMPWTSRLGPMPDPEDNPRGLYSEAAVNTLNRLEAGGPEGEAVRTLALHLDNNFQRIEEMLVALLARRDQWLRHLGVDIDADLFREQMEETLRKLAESACARLENALPKNFQETLPELLRFRALNLNRPEWKGWDDLRSCREAAEFLLKQDNDWRKRLTVTEGIPPGAKKEKQTALNLIASLAGDENSLQALVELKAVPDPEYSESQWNALAALLTLLPVAAAELKLVFAERGKVDFVEVSEAARRALGGDTGVTDLALYLGERFEHILVDEVQDTSVSQSKLLHHLISSWSPGDGRTLFLVGDPMQSIYKFREADVGLFLRMRSEGLAGTRPQAITLSANFRSRPPVVEWVNQAFAHIFPGEEDIARGAVAYSPSDAFRDDGDSGVEVHPIFERLDEAPLVAELVNKGASGSTAILVRAKNHATEIATELNRRGIRFRAVEIDRLNERPVVNDLLAITRALLHPADRTAWLAILRAPWCGLTLSDLHRIASADERRTVRELIADRGETLTDDGRARLERVFNVVEEALPHARRKALRPLVESVWIRLGGPQCASSLADAERFLDMLQEIEVGGEVASLEELERRTAGLFADPDSSAPAEGPGSVQIMTIHKAKGLQFDTVILPGLGRKSGNHDKPLLRWGEVETAEGPELLFAPVESRGDDSGDKVYQYLKQLDKSRADHETVRLLYVAATRARERLHLVGKANIDKTGTVMSAPPRDWLLSLLWPMVHGEYERAFAEWKGRGELREKPPREFPKLRRVLAGWTPPRPDPGVAWSPREEEEPGEPVTFDWAGDTLRHVGTVVHAYLARIASEGLSRWPRERVKKQSPAFEAALESLGVPPGELSLASRRVEDAIANTLMHPIGRAILEGGDDAQCEFAASVEIGGIVRHCVVDRTFVDTAGVRWIVDYKTSFIEGGGMEAFLSNEMRRYAGQLGRYVRLFAALESRPIRAGLYFPLLAEWREMESAAEVG